MLCPGIQLSKGQKKVLGDKLSAKDFVYSALPMIWTREVLCTHSMTGKKSNAHRKREAKPQLDVEKVDSLCSKYKKCKSLIYSCNFVTVYLQCTIL